MKKYFVFRENGCDEGSVAPLTEREVKQIQDKIDALTDGDNDPPYYIYEMDWRTAAAIHKMLDEDLRERQRIFSEELREKENDND